MNTPVHRYRALAYCVALLVMLSGCDMASQTPLESATAIPLELQAATPSSDQSANAAEAYAQAAPPSDPFATTDHPTRTVATAVDRSNAGKQTTAKPATATPSPAQSAKSTGKPLPSVSPPPSIGTSKRPTRAVTTTVLLSDAGIQIKGVGVQAKGSILTITADGVYEIKGRLSNGQIVVNAPKAAKVELLLSGVGITSSVSAAIYCMNADDLIISLADGTDNVLTDAAKYTYADKLNEEPNAALFSKVDMNIGGGGSLTVNANFNHGISSKDDLLIEGGNFTIRSASHGIRGKDSLTVLDGHFTIEAGGDAMQSSNTDRSNGPELLRNFSKNTNVKIYLVDADGDVLISCINGKPGAAFDTDVMQKELPYILKNLQTVLDGESSKQVIDSEKRNNMSLVIGVPATYHGSRAAIFIHQSLAAMQTMQELNRNQLVTLSVIMTMMASFIAILLTRNFTKPIHNIENAVMRLAEGDLRAKPDVKRDDELGRLSKSVEELGVALQRVDVLRREVIANVSHELSAPLSLILGYSEMVRDITGDDPKRRIANMDLIIRETSRLSHMVDDIMDYSKFQSGYGTLHIAACNLYELMITEAEVVRQTTAEYGVHIELSSYAKEIEINVDPLKISQVIRNLLNNAVNHTAEGQAISISIVKDGDAVRVNVRNPGKPIPEEEQKLIWERYHRVQHQGGRREGTGIGLSIVSTILEAHGFAYGVESGTNDNTFWFRIPCQNTLDA